MEYDISPKVHNPVHSFYSQFEMLDTLIKKGNFAG